MGPVVFKTGSTFKKSAKRHPEIQEKFKKFVQFKSKNPTAQFGASDKPFVGKGSFGRMLPGLMHAHLNSDVSIVYKVSGTNPTTIYLYGFYSHSELGTGTPPNLNKQQSAAQKFSNTTFENKQGSLQQS